MTRPQDWQPIKPWVVFVAGLALGLLIGGPRLTVRVQQCDTPPAPSGAAPVEGE